MKKLLAGLICVLLTACQADDSISRDYRCNFIFYTSLHPLPCQLTGILGNSGHFVKIQSSLQQGIRHLKTTRNFDNATEDIPLTTAKESQFNYYLGANDCIIIGMSSYDNLLVAYDGQCPNCLADFNGISYPLTWQSNGKLLHCAKCNRSYDVNNGIIADGTPGNHNRLLKYIASFDGDLIHVWN
jgi:hypothetical protein